MNGKTLWFIVTPVYRPAPGGGAIYTDTIARALAQQGDDIVVETEEFPGESAIETLAIGPGSVRIERMFPFRAGRAQRDWKSYSAYFWQTIRLVKIPGRLVRARKDCRPDNVVVLLHSSLFYKPSSLPRLLPLLRRAAGEKAVFVLDVRDYGFPDSRASVLDQFDRIVTSSEGVAQELGVRFPQIAGRLRPIAMPFVSPRVPSEEEVTSALEQFGLQRGRYLFNPNGLTSQKLTAELRDAVSLLRKNPDFRDFVLVSAGRDRDRTAQDDAAEAQGSSIFLGAQKHPTILALMRGAAMTAILSKREAISRAALEAMAVGGQVLLPDLPEFRATCAANVCVDVSAEAVAKKIAQLINEPAPQFGFDKHGPDCFVPLYRSLPKT